MKRLSMYDRFLFNSDPQCSDLLFKRIYENVSIEEIEPFLNDIPSIELNKSETENKKLVDTLYQCGLAKSKSIF